MMKNEQITPIELVYQDISLTCPIEDGHRMIPVRTVCKIIDVNFQSQDNWLKQHPFFSQLYRPSTTTGLDNKTYEMNCLSIFDVAGWVHSIQSKGRKPGSVDKQYLFLAWLREQTLELYKSVDVFIKENKYEQELLSLKDETSTLISETQKRLKDLKKELKTIDERIEQVRYNRFTGQTALDFPE